MNRKLLKLLLVCYLTTIFSACSGMYYGYTKDQWEAMDLQQQAEIRKEFEVAIRLKDEMSRVNKIEELAEEFEKRGVESER